MSGIVGLALRMAATRALTGATMAGARVFDSAILPIDELAKSEPKPFVVVSTEDDRSEPGGRDINNGAREIQLVIECAVSFVRPLPGIEDEEIVVPNTDATLELTLAILGRQISACLFGRGGGAWGDLFRKLTAGVPEVVSRRGIQSKDGVRLAARQIVYSIRAMAEPAFGVAPEEGSPLSDFIAAMQADEQTAALASVVARSIQGQFDDWPTVYDAASVLGGYTDEEGQAIGIAPLAPALEEGDTEVALQADVQEIPDGDVWPIDEAEIEAQLPTEPDP